MVDINVTRKVEIATKRMEDTGAEKTEKMWGSMKKMADDIRSMSLDKYKADVMDRIDDAKVHMDRNVDSVKTGIRDHPFESVAIAAGAGILFGAVLAMMGRRAVRSRM